MALVLGLLATGVVSAGAHGAAPAPPPEPAAEEPPAPPPARPPEIVGPSLPPRPAPSTGRLAIAFGGNRRWCTYPDDRIIRPPKRPREPIERNAIYTFGYKFSVSAVKRGRADAPLVLFESPEFRTASWRPASKVGQSQKKAPGGPIISAEDEGPPKPRPMPKGPDTLVPYWQEMFRCVTMPERMDFDLEPGTYDVYIAFDILNRDGSWVHRMTGYLTDVPVEEGRRTRVDGVVNLGSGANREVDLLGSTFEPDAVPPSAPGP